MGENHNRVESIFGAALEIDSPELRQAFLDENCGDDLEIKKQIESLLEANEEIGSFLKEPSELSETNSMNSDALSPTYFRGYADLSGEKIGPYCLIKQIGRGGMGTVYIAKQEKPIKRSVAIKVINPGMDSNEVLARFDAERQALAMMNHPNIAQVLDAGQTAAGYPYFVMELVDGLPITEYCDQNRLSTKERLKLFVDVCKAVQHAHQKAIIHRDIKPSNILAATHDQPMVKVIDFGIAKATNQRLTEQTLQTKHSQIMGTPLYMSPEQADLSSKDIDTRSDIYSLGVLLYELLTGKTPFDRERLREVGFDGIRQIIQNEEPPRPSSRLEETVSDLETVSKLRDTAPGQLRHSVRGDLDWIVMKALEKDRTRRYETANGLAEDIERHLREEPVSAGPPSATYRIRKFVRRNRVGVIAASLVGITLIAGLIGTGGGLVWALSEKARANSAAETAIAKETTSRNILEFFVGLFDEARPSQRRGEPMTVNEFLDVGADRLDELSADEPDTRAMLQETIGTLYVLLAQFDKAKPLLENAVDYRGKKANKTREDELAYASALKAAADVHQWQNYDRAVETAREASEIFERHLGDSPKLLHSLNVLGNALQRKMDSESALEAYGRSLEIAQKLWPPGHEKRPDVAIMLHNIGNVHMMNFRLAEAENYYQQSLEIEKAYVPEDDPNLATSKHTLSMVYAYQHKYEKAKEWQLEALKTRQKVFTPDHHHVGLSLNWMGFVNKGLRNYEQSESFLKKAIEIHMKQFGLEHDMVVWEKTTLAETLIKLKKFEEVLEILKELEASPKIDTFSDPTDRAILRADIAVAKGELEPAKKLLLNAISDFRSKNPDVKFDQSTAIANLKLDAVKVKLGEEFDESQYQNAVNHLIEGESWIETNADLLDLQIEIADALFENGKHEQAAEIYSVVKTRYETVLSGDDVDPYWQDLAARFLVSCKNSDFRSSDRALELAKDVVENVSEPSPHYLRTLSKAQRLENEKDEATKTLEKAIGLLASDSIWFDEFNTELEQLKTELEFVRGSR